MDETTDAPEESFLRLMSTTRLELALEDAVDAGPGTAVDIPGADGRPCPGNMVVDWSVGRGGGVSAEGNGLEARRREASGLRMRSLSMRKRVADDGVRGNDDE